MTEPTAITATPDRGRLEAALLKAIGFDRLAPEQRELALKIAGKYDLDPMLKHLVMIDGRPYITRDGLLHVAHRSGYLDGIEVTDPVLVDGYWRATAAVYRKDMTRPFKYAGRYPEAGRNRQYAPEMATKVAEVMALRRAFDVAAPVAEERWAEPSETGEEEATGTQPPRSLSERVEQRAAAITADPTPPSETASTDTTTADNTPVVAEGGMTLADFSKAIEGMDREVVIAAAKTLFPDRKKFGDLEPGELADLLDYLLEMGEPDEGEDEPPGSAPVPAEPEPDAGGPGAFVIDSVEMVPPAEDQTPAVAAPVAPQAPTATVTLCGAASPYSPDLRCQMDAGHKGPHRSGLRESW